MMKKSNSLKITLLVLPYLFNDLFITVITGKRIGWMRASEGQNKIFAAIVLLLFIYGFIYLAHQHKNIIKTYTIKLVLYLIILIASLIFHMIYFEEPFAIIIVYVSCAVLQFIIIKDVDIEQIESPPNDDKKSKQQKRRKNVNR